MHRRIRLEEQLGGEAREASTFDCLLIGRMERRCLSIAFAGVQSVILVLQKVWLWSKARTAIETNEGTQWDATPSLGLLNHK